MACRARKLTQKNDGFQNKLLTSEKRYRVKLKNQRQVEEKTSESKNSVEEDLALCPTGAFKALLSARLSAAFWSNISDCDETFNYWEPLHNLLYGKGFQTWEYSPEYGLRSYFYLLIHAVVANVYSMLFQGNRLLVFYFLRCVLALVCVTAEVYFYRCVSLQFGRKAGLLTLVFQIFGSGMFISSTALLPSSFSMYMTLISIGSWFKGNHPLAVFSTAVSAIVSWPFAGLIGLPIAIDMVLFKRKIKEFILWSIISLFAILVPVVWIEQQYYGKLVIPPLNIVLYNVFSSHGPDLYGTEPISFYIFNGFLNFNFVFLGAFLALPAGFVASRLNLLSRSPSGISYWLAVLPLYLWFAVFFLQPHKEERFLFPVYPLICMCGGVVIDWLEKIVKYFLNRLKFQKSMTNSNDLIFGFCLVYVVLALSRTCALYKGFHGSMDAYISLSNKLDSPELENQSVNVCVGKEWHRFPSSFFFPSNNWSLLFLKSEFRGQLPQYYQPGLNSTSVVPEHMNDLNQEEDSRYTTLDTCDYLVDLDLSRPTPLEPQYIDDLENWTVVYSAPFLDVAKSPSAYRAFYIPLLTGNKCTYGNYYVLKRTKV